MFSTMRFNVIKMRYTCNRFRSPFLERVRFIWGFQKDE